MTQLDLRDPDTRIITRDSEEGVFCGIFYFAWVQYFPSNLCVHCQQFYFVF